MAATLALVMACTDEELVRRATVLEGKIHRESGEVNITILSRMLKDVRNEQVRRKLAWLRKQYQPPVEHVRREDCLS